MPRASGSRTRPPRTSTSCTRCTRGTRRCLRSRPGSLRRPLPPPLPVRPAPPAITPKELVEAGYIRRAGTLAGLAVECGLDPGGLERTVERFNRFAKLGVTPTSAEARAPTTATTATRASGRTRAWRRSRSRRSTPSRCTPATWARRGPAHRRARARRRARRRAVRAPLGGGQLHRDGDGADVPGPGASLGAAMTFAYLAMLDAAR